MHPMILFPFCKSTLALVAIILFQQVIGAVTVSRLTILDEKTNEEIASFELEENGSFSISFVHSVNQSLVEEGYECRNGCIFLVSCLYRNFGAGVASEVPENVLLQVMENGWMKITGLNLKMDYLAYIVGTVSDHVLRIDSQEYSLLGLCGRNRFILLVWR